MSGTKPGDQVRQFKEMVRELHAAGIESFSTSSSTTRPKATKRADVLLQRAGEQSLLHAERQRHVQKLLRMRQHGERQSSGDAGDDLPLPSPLVHNYHIDGFRFDLASILSRNR